jgi:cytochrome c
MNRFFIVVAGAFIAAASFSAAYAADAEKGKTLFESPTLGGSTNEKSCLTCHAKGTKLNGDLFEREKHTIMGMEKDSVADLVNVCIEKPLGGTAIDPTSNEMTDILAYMKTLVKSAEK